MTTNDKTYLYYLKITIVPMIVLISLGLFVWQFNINRLNEKEQLNVSTVIRNSVREEVQKRLILPQVVFINTDSSQKKKLDEKLVEQITQVLTKKYLLNDTIKFKDLDIKPFFVYPKKSDKETNYTLSESQLDELRNHIDFLTKQIDVQLEKSKEETGKDIDRLNLWVTIWIGIIGFLGIFIPIIINVDTTRNAEKATEKSEEAARKSQVALDKITNAQTQIDKITGIEEKISAAEKKLEGISGKSDTTEKKVESAEGKANAAEKKSEKAYETSEKTERLLTAVNAISNLKNIDSGLLPHINEPKKFLGSTLEKVHAGLNNCTNHFTDDIVKDCIQQLGIYLHLLSFFKFLDHTNTQQVNSFVNTISDTFTNQYDKSSFEKILSELKTLSNNLMT